MCARTNTVFFRISEVSKGTVSLSSGQPKLPVTLVYLGTLEPSFCKLGASCDQAPWLPLSQSPASPSPGAPQPPLSAPAPCSFGQLQELGIPWEHIMNIQTKNIPPILILLCFLTMCLMRMSGLSNLWLTDTARK